MNTFLERTELLLGTHQLEKLKNAHVLVVGLGGVGAYVAEMLCRAGVGTLSIVDNDNVHASNRNRQLLALLSTDGRNKAEVMAERLKDINPDIQLHVYPVYVKDQVMIDILEMAKYDFVVDAIDTLSPKIYLLYHCTQMQVPVVSSMGSGGKLNPQNVQIADIAQTHHCPLADVVRKKLHKLGVYNGIYTVFSPEEIPAHAMILNENEPNKKSTVGTISYMPALFGMMCASVVIRRLLGHDIKSDLPIPKKVKQQLASCKKS